jgi:hypothetical protein
MSPEKMNELVLSLNVHFEGQVKNYPNISCDTCLDKKTGDCEGNGYKGDECIDCMIRNPHVRVYLVGSKEVLREAKKYYKK